MTIQITRPDVEAIIKRRLESGGVQGRRGCNCAGSQVFGREERAAEEVRREAIERLRTFGKTHGLSLGGMTIRELRHEARP